MWLKSLHLINVKSFADSGEVMFSKGINVLVGPNNAGKSVLLKSIYTVQGPENSNIAGDFLTRTLRVGAVEQEVRLVLAEPNKKQLRILQPNFDITNWTPEFRFISKQNQIQSLMRKNNPSTDFLPFNGPICLQREPDNLIYPYFSNRKPTGFDLAINSQNEIVVEEVFTHLPAKIDRISNSRHHGYASFESACNKCFQLQISTAAYHHGKQAGLMLRDGSLLPVDAMGEGTSAVLTLLSHLCVAKGKIFLIEEPENDIHPKALKALLEVIIKSSQENQFIVSTHSNIVLSVLGGVPDAHVFSLKMQLEKDTEIPTSTCTLLDGDPESRIRLLEDLGYQPSDLYLYDAYLVLEESTAEQIIRDFLIPQMFPALRGRLRTISARGVTNVAPYFEDFYRLFVYLHTAPQYRHRAWVAVDAGTEGAEVVSKLTEKFHTWPSTHFRTWSKTVFEDFYPPQFKAETDRAMAIQSKKQRQDEKGKLAKSVLAWCVANPGEAKKWFTDTAPDVIALLTEIQFAIVNR